jgi:hypothetical protein
MGLGLGHRYCCSCSFEMAVQQKKVEVMAWTCPVVVTD